MVRPVERLESSVASFTRWASPPERVVADLIKTADHIIDLGPEGGNRGGTIVAQGTPEQVAQVAESYTGQYLRPLLGK